ncbi:MAG: hypothetical protein GWN84_02575 [Gammaproteobacteria bacterium]|nr:hypothetical protein [Gammaproteobacteria bacterium]NIR82037.1 hypothetical protein [Gammaproteobacteria bacterium]NIR89265.1 hypothetical protein [Gammaproteobacteria bacterium]NIU03147.1 hypothetical protein [Gammaproteobacteria bacterium]NIV50663.1 hypothetical protein [Gammaproteobacteria bacterium]
MRVCSARAARSPPSITWRRTQGPRSCARLIDPDRAHPEIRPGDPARGRALLPPEQRLGGKPWGPGTVHVDVIDRDGNMVSATPSGAWLRSQEVVGALGFPLGNRLMTFCLNPPHHPNLIAPGKRPRTTVSHSLCYRGGRPWMVFGSMGGDQQGQWQLQFFLNRVVFGHTLPRGDRGPQVQQRALPGVLRTPRFLPQPLACGAADPGGRARGARSARPRPRGRRRLVRRLSARRRPRPRHGNARGGLRPSGAKSEVFSAQALCW